MSPQVQERVATDPELAKMLHEYDQRLVAAERLAEEVLGTQSYQSQSTMVALADFMAWGPVAKAV